MLCKQPGFGFWFFFKRSLVTKPGAIKPREEKDGVGKGGDGLMPMARGYARRERGLTGQGSPSPRRLRSGR
jgi:hypothetical protein